MFFECNKEVIVDETKDIRTIPDPLRIVPCLLYTSPHLYIYTIGNVGEAMIAKRRTYAQTQGYLTPPFKELSLIHILKVR